MPEYKRGKSEKSATRKFLETVRTEYRKSIGRNDSVKHDGYKVSAAKDALRFDLGELRVGDFRLQLLNGQCGYLGDVTDQRLDALVGRFKRQFTRPSTALRAAVSSAVVAVRVLDIQCRQLNLSAWYVYTSAHYQPASQRVEHAVLDRCYQSQC